MAAPRLARKGQQERVGCVGEEPANCR